MSTARSYQPKYSVADYRQWEGDWELWHGYPVSMTPSPFGEHQSIAARLVSQLSRQLDQSDCDCRVLYEIDWIMHENTVVRPDVIVVCGPLPKGHVQRTPALVAEVLSDSTRDKDIGPKKDLYFEQQVPIYVVIDPRNQTVEASLWQEAEWKKIEQNQSATIDLTVGTGCPLQIDIADLFR